MNSLGFFGVLASVINFLLVSSSALGVGGFPPQSFREEPGIQKASLAIAAYPLHSAKFATLTKLSPSAARRYILTNVPRVEFTPRDGWQTLLQEFVRPQLAVQSIGQKFQVQVKGQLVAEVASQDQADLMVWQLQQMTLNPDFDPQSLHPGLGLRPGMRNATPVGKAENEVLFWIDRHLASRRPGKYRVDGDRLG